MKCMLDVQRETISLENGEIKSIFILLHLDFFVKKYFSGWGLTQQGCNMFRCLVAEPLRCYLEMNQLIISYYFQCQNVQNSHCICTNYQWLA